MFSVALLLLLAAGSCVKCEQLTQPVSVTVQPGQHLTITCQVSYSLSSYWTGWIRQPAGKGLEWIGSKYTGGSYYKDSLKNKFSIDVDSSSNTVTLNGQNVQPEDTAVYYCARGELDFLGLPNFDYWGKGTAVTVQSEASQSPTLFPVVQCKTGSGKMTVGCLAHDFSPKHLIFQWTDASGTALTSVQHSSVSAQNNKYIGVSFIQISKSDWDSRKSYNCTVTHVGAPKILHVQKPIPAKVTLISVPSEDTQALVCTIEDSRSGTLEPFKWKKNDVALASYIESSMKKTGELNSAVSVLKVSNTDWDSKAVYTCEATYRGTIYTRKISKGAVTVTLEQPSPKIIFSNNQAKLDCVITGQDRTIVDETQITWEIDGEVTSGVLGQVKSSSTQYSKTSTVTLDYTKWQNVNKVRCSATREDMTPVIQDLTVHRGEGRQTKVTVHVLPDEDIDKGDSTEVTLVCLVSSPVQQDYYIAWTEQSERDSGIYADGINFFQDKNEKGFSVTSVYKTTKKNWNEKHIFYCHVRPAGSTESMTSRGVSKAKGNSIECRK
nr:immunoglobulin tau heavy chain secreted form [Lates calcarifer]